MTALESIDPARWLSEQASAGDTDVLRSMVAAFANAMMSAEADAACGAGDGQRSGGTRQQPQRLPGPGMGHPGPGSWSCRSRNCAAAPTSPTGSSSTADGRNRPTPKIDVNVVSESFTTRASSSPSLSIRRSVGLGLMRYRSVLDDPLPIGQIIIDCLRVRLGRISVSLPGGRVVDGCRRRGFPGR
jgi:hypothetical protein